MRKPRDIDAELKALQEKAKQLKVQRTLQLGELVGATGADTLSIEALAGVLLAAVEQADGKPEAVARWTERGTAFFLTGAKKNVRKGSGKDQNGITDA
ncbi:conjugal transfer protein TraD [Acetobacter thailandicus]|uniref:conjugal transfer protein TraD n=1 Tax=Acetobacter thailandicus TaxID=1502842 RepID=UPI001BAABE36|nr:conjugal transfer protein TraD [Acetobacter thailandicus]MBS0961226.1 conjugal transfer protein TraD [Acetobacter thailandicus]